MCYTISSSLNEVHSCSTGWVRDEKAGCPKLFGIEPTAFSQGVGSGWGKEFNPCQIRRLLNTKTQKEEKWKNGCPHATSRTKGTLRCACPTCGAYGVLPAACDWCHKRISGECVCPTRSATSTSLKGKSWHLNRGLPKETLKNYSWSQAKKYANCGQQYKYSKVFGLPEKASTV